MIHFFAMGGYAAFVWPAYGITLIALGAAIADTLRAYFRAKAMLEKIESGASR
ncbi:MAG: heme exporter protein CcmD [Rhizomicrobium sp.]